MPPEGEGTETLEAPAQTDADTTTPDTFGDQAQALEERLGGQEAPAEAEPEGLAADASFVDYLSQRGEEGQQVDGEDADPGYADEPASDEDDTLRLIDDYLDASVQERVAPIIQQIEDAEKERQLRSMADGDFPDLRKPEMLDAIGKQLGPLAEKYGDDALRNDPKLVRMAYEAEKARQIAAAEKPAKPGSGTTLERGAASQPDPGESYEQSVQNAIVNAGPGNGDLW